MTDYKKRDTVGNALDKIVWPEPIRDSPVSSSIAIFTSWWQALPPLPILQSDIVVYGTVIRRSAHLTVKVDGIYSAFVIKPGIIFKDAAPGDFRIDREMICTRIGGGVRFPSGRIRQYRMPGEGFPSVNEDYLLFLKLHKPSGALRILTGYWDNGGRVEPLDSNSDSGRMPFEEFRGMDSKKLLTQVEDFSRCGAQGCPK